MIPGWDEGLVGATAGERLQLDIPNELAYGDEARGDVIQAGDALTFVIDVLAVVAGRRSGAGRHAGRHPDVGREARPTSRPTTCVPATGATLEEGMTGLFHLVAARRDDGTILQSTWDAMQPQPLTVIDRGARCPASPRASSGMQVGGRRVVVLPDDRRQRAHAGDRRRHHRRPPRRPS